MMAQLPFSGGRLVIVLLLGFGLYIAIRHVRSWTGQMPLSRGRRQLVDRLRPLAEALLTVAYALTALRILVGAELLYSGFSLVVFGLVLLFVAWFVLRDLLAGLLIKVSEICLPGDTITVGDLRGRVRSLGSRLVALDTEDGGRAFVPYSQLTRRALVRHGVPDGVFPHSFDVELSDLPAAKAVPLLRRHILSCHWSSVVKEPRICPEEGHYHVTLFALAEHRGPTIEEFLRRALKKQGFPAQFHSTNPPQPK